MAGHVQNLVFLAFLVIVDVHCFPLTNVKTEDDFVNAHTSSGIVRGRKHHIDGEKDLNIFLGVPYAAPPVDRRRFAKPFPVRPWHGVRDALVHGAKCIQLLIPGDPVLDNVPFSEDCLFLDIYSPRPRSNESQLDSKMAVMMFIHGGSFYGGSGAKYNFTNLASKGVVVVTINYRLGVFGFLSTADDVIPGNFGMLDMVMALDWVKQNIKSFGGDPERITLFGGSAGAASVSLLTLSPLSRGKFQQAIMQSGVSISKWVIQDSNSTMAAALSLAKDLGRRVGCQTSNESVDISKELLDCLRHLPASAILAADDKIKASATLGDMPVWRPILETTFGFCPESPERLLQDPSLLPIPTIRGYTKNDGSFMIRDTQDDGLTVEELHAMFRFMSKSYYPDNSNEVLKAVKDFYFPKSISDTASNLEIRDIAINFMTDINFLAPTIREAIMYNKNHQGLQSFIYELDHRPSYLQSASWLGIEHASEKGFVLDLPEGPDAFKYPHYTQVDSEVADLVSTLWTNFAKYGNPTVEEVDNLIWSPFISETKNVLSQCESSSSGSPFKPNLQYNLLKINLNSKMVLFDKCDQVNFWAQFR